MDVLFNLLVNGLATGMLVFLLAAGLALIFGLMDVLNFGHGALFAWGAYTGVWSFAWTGSFLFSVFAAIIAGAALGWILERWVIRPVYGNHLQQILVTLGILLVLSELLKVVWGPNPINSGMPSYLDGSWQFGGVILIKYRVFIIAVGLLVFAGLQYLLTRTKLGLVVRAGVMNKEMIQALGFNIKSDPLQDMVLFNMRMNLLDIKKRHRITPQGKPIEPTHYP